MPPRPDFDSFLAGRDPHAASLMRRLRPFLRKRLSRPVETADPDFWGIGRGAGYRDTLFVISPQRGYVTLGISDSASLPDPDRLLEGAGKRHRHLKIREASQLKDPKVIRLIDAAVKRFAAG